MQALSPPRARVALVAIGVICELVYLLYFVWQFPLLRYYRTDIDMGTITGHSHAGFVAFVASFILLFALLGAAWWVARPLNDRATLWLILGFGALFSVTLTFMYPVTAIDIFAYIDQSRILLHYHANPMFVPPSQFPNDPIMALSDGFRGVPAPYGPISIFLSALPMIVVGGNLLANLILLKLMYSAMLLACAYLVYRIVQQVDERYALTGALLVAWNPLLLFEIGGNGHNDVSMMLLALLGVQSLVEGEFFFGLLLVVLSVLVKYATGLLLPLVLVFAIGHLPTLRARIRFVITSGVCSLLLVAAAYRPFWQGLDTLKRPLFENQFHIESFDTVLVSLLAGNISIDRATLIGRILFISVYLYALHLASRDVRGFLCGCFLAMSGFLALGANNVKIWYALWPTILAPLIPSSLERTAALLLALGTSLTAAIYGYIWVWGGLRNFPQVNSAAYALAFVPGAIILTAAYMRDSRPPTDADEHTTVASHPVEAPGT